MRKIWWLYTLLILSMLAAPGPWPVAAAPQASAAISPQAPGSGEMLYPVFSCMADGSVAQPALTRGLLFRTENSFRGLELRFAANQAGMYSFKAELRRSGGFDEAPIAILPVTIEVPNLPAPPYPARLLDFGSEFPVNGLETFTVKFTDIAGPGDLSFESYGADRAPCPNGLVTEETAGPNPLLTGGAAMKLMSVFYYVNRWAAPVLDGYIAQNEWDWAHRYCLGTCFNNGFIILQSDGLRLYILIDIYQDTTVDVDKTDNFNLTFDINKDLAITPGVDLDYSLTPGTRNLRYAYYQGPGTLGPYQLSTRSARAEGFGCFPADFSQRLAASNQVICEQHVVYEIGIDLDEIGAAPGGVARLGLRVKSNFPSYQYELPVGFATDFLYLIPAKLPSYLFLPQPGHTIGWPVDPLEVTQAIQTRANSLPLVADKTTVVRMYVTESGLAQPQPVKAFLYGQATLGIDLPGSPLLMLHNAPPVIDRAKLGHTANFQLPATWDQGNLTLWARARSLLGQEIVTAPQTFNLQARRIPVLWYLPVNTGTANMPNLVAKEVMDTQLDYVRAAFPIAGLSAVEQPWTAIGPTQPDQVIQRLNQYWNATLWSWLSALLQNGTPPFPFPDQIYGFLPGGGGLSNPTWLGGRGLVGMGYWGTSREGTLAHEWNHNLDKSSNGTWGRHVNACGAKGPDPAWPYPNHTIQEVGFDTRQPWMQTAGKTTVIAGDFPDLMSYCASEIPPTKWLSPYRWTNLFNAFALSASLAPLHNGGEAPATTSVYYLTGRIRQDGTGELDAAFPGLGAASPTVSGGNAVLELVDAGNQTLISHPFNVGFLVDPEEPVSAAEFALQVPMSAATARIVLRYNGNIVDETPVSANAPSVTVLSANGGETWSGVQTVSWSASDVDSDPLTYNLFYSPDGGASWLPVAAGLTETSYSVDTRYLPGSTNARFRVQASDGARLGEDDSDSAFTVLRQAPLVSILPPALLPANQLLTFHGAAAGGGPQSLPDQNFLWLEGNPLLGVGRDLTISLPPGQHTLTLRVDDGYGNFGSAEVTVQVGVQAFLPWVKR